MPFTGSAGSKTFARTTGLQAGSTAWADTESASRGIESTDHDTHDQDIAAALNQAMLKDGGTTATANLPMGNFKITGLGTGTDAADAVNKAQMDAAVVATVNATVRIATTANVNLTTDVDDGSTVDGVAVATGDRILIKSNTAPAENGVYVVPAAAGTAARATDFDTYNEHVASIINVTAGTVNAGLSFRCTANTGGTINVTAISYVQFGTTLSTPVSLANGGTASTTAADAFTALKQAASSTATGVIEHATDAETWAATAGNLAITPAIAASAGAEVAVSDGATITIDFSAGINFAVGALGGNRTLAASNYTGLIGRSGYIKFLQDATGTRTLNSTAAPFVNGGGTDIVLSTAASAVDFVFYQIVSIGGSAKIILTIITGVA